MVRKRKRRNDESDNSESDVDYDPNSSRQPAAKKYSLRERKSRVPNILEYYDEDYMGRESSDEDFQIEADIETANYYMQDDAGAEPSEGLIDFEDIIRADIVAVNKSRIDYDNVIQKTEIKSQQAPHQDSGGGSEDVKAIGLVSETDDDELILLEPKPELIVLDD